MPIRTGLSHAFIAILVALSWTFFNRSLELLLTQNQIEGAVVFMARIISEHSGLTLGRSKLLSILTIFVVTLFAFTWGYLFHKSRFESS